MGRPPCTPQNQCCAGGFRRIFHRGAFHRNKFRKFAYSAPPSPTLIRGVAGGEPLFCTWWHVPASFVMCMDLWMCNLRNFFRLLSGLGIDVSGGSLCLHLKEATPERRTCVNDVCLFVWRLVRVYTCVHIYIYIYICTYLYIYRHIDLYDCINI